MKREFKKSVYILLEQDQRLSGAERKLVNDEIKEFVKMYEEATGEKPKPDMEILYLFVPRLRKYGFKMSIIDISIEEDMLHIRRVMKRKGINPGAER